MSPPPSAPTAVVPKKSCFVGAENQGAADPHPPRTAAAASWQRGAQEWSAESSSERHAHFDDGETESSRTNAEQPESEEDVAKGGEREVSAAADVESEEDDDDDDDDADDDDDDSDHRGAQAFRRRREASVRSRSSTSAASHASLTQKIAAASMGVGVRPAASSSQRRQSHPQVPHSKSPLVHRWDEYGDFVSRSERSRRGRAVDTDAADWENNNRPTSGSGSTTGTSGVQFGNVHETELPPLHPDDRSKCYMTHESWERIDLDVELTKKRWNNHTAGLLPFDHGANTTRGLECVLCETRGRQRDLMLVQHATSVLQEQNRQKLSGEFYNAQSMRQVASQTSLQDEAYQQGQHDAEDARNAWLQHPPSNHNVGSGSVFVPASHNHPKKKGKPTTKSTVGKKHRKGGGLLGLLGLHSKPKPKSTSSKS